MSLASSVLVDAGPLIALIARNDANHSRAADATIVAVAELENIWRIFTFDNHFYVYRPAEGKTLEVVPS